MLTDMAKNESKEMELEKFKKLLQYFLLHLEYNHWRYNYEKEKGKKGVNPDEFDWPDSIEEEIKESIKNGKKTGQGYNDDAIQNQIEKWCYYSVGKVCISVRYSPGGGYTSKASYLHWPGTGLNINAKWNADKNKIEYLYYRNVDDADADVDDATDAVAVVDDGAATDAVADVDAGAAIDAVADVDAGAATDAVADGDTTDAATATANGGNEGNRPTYSISREDLFGTNTELEKLYNYYISEKKNCLNKKADFLAKLLVQNHNLILTGAPGTGKTFMAKKIAKQLISSEDHLCFVQFHPSFDYTDFVEGLRPDYDDDNDDDDDETKNKTKERKQIVFKRKDGIFKAFCVKAAKDIIDHKYVFIIDEINRGEISKIFGELFFSIDPEYRGEQDEEGNSHEIRTQYQNLIDHDTKLDNDYPFKKGFYVPENVFVIGTMNDIDRSVESIDFAFRRRFSFVEVTASESESMIYGKGWSQTHVNNAIQRMQALNSAIVDPQIGGLASQYQIGGAYFLKLGKLGFDFEKLWRDNLAGLLYEYYRGQPNAKEILNQLKDRYDLKKNNGK